MKRSSFLTLLFLALLLGVLSTLPAQQVRAGDGRSAKVLATSLNVRSEPDGESSIVGSLKQGAVVTASDEAYGWVKVSSGRLSGWVAGYYLQIGAGSTADKPKSSASSGKPANGTAAGKALGQASVTADTLYMREGPGTDNSIVSVLSLGTSLNILDRKNGWVKVRTTDDQTGWVSGKYVGNPKAVSSVQKSGSKGLKGKTIVIDPGHGGNDHGVIGSKHKTSEKTINLSTARYLAEQLKQAGAKAILTRTSDKKIELQDRVNVSVKNRADAFVSIHYNSSPKQVSGTLTFFYSESKDLPLARSIASSLDRNLNLKSNGYSYGNYHVLRENSRPSVLVELGFLTNPKDEAVVRGADYQRKAAAAIVEGLSDYFNQ